MAGRHSREAAADDHALRSQPPVKRGFVVMGEQPVIPRPCVGDARRSSTRSSRSRPAWEHPLPNEDAATATEMVLHVLAYDLTRVINIIGPGRLSTAIAT